MPRFARTLAFLAILVFVAVCVQAQTASGAPMTPVRAPAGDSPEAGVSHALAFARAARLRNLRYNLIFRLRKEAAEIGGVELLTFDLDGPLTDLPIDFRDGEISVAEVNGHILPGKAVEGHLILPAAYLKQSANSVRFLFSANSASAGKAITRYHDKDDANDYLYTLFVPMDADMAFPCFDQPDLKARFTLTVEHPADWTVIGNTAGAQNNPTSTSFPETLPISTYLFAFAAGPWQSLPGKSGEPTLYVRKSQLARARQEAPQVQEITARGITFLSDYFQQPFPFPKYDLVLIPGFPFGGMEHAGATFLNEDGVLFRTAPTESDFFRRNTLVLHETTHQWFGDLVTMRWFDDLWLKEGFAQYMAYKALAQLEPASNPWKHFFEDIKPLAYAIDETEGTTPIYQNIPNLKDAKSAYGAIVYQKAPAVLKQLNFFLGEDNFRDGLRLYLKQHSYSNAQWADLVNAFLSTGNKDVKSWADAWILQRGMPEVTVSKGCSGGKITGLVLHQHDVLGHGALWPVSNEIFLAATRFAQDRNGRIVYSVPVQTIAVDWSTAEYSVAQAIGMDCPNIVFANQGDFAYGRFPLDDESGLLAASALLPNKSPAPAELYKQLVSSEMEPLRRSMFWTALWERVRIAEDPARDFAAQDLFALPTESDEALNRIQGARVATALHAYLGPKARQALLPQAEAVIADRMLHAPTPGLRIVNFRTFTSVAETPAALAQLKQLLAGTLTVEGMPLKPLDRWNIVGHLIAQNDPDGKTLFAAEQARDHSGEAQKYAYAAQAGAPDPATKARYFSDYLNTAGSPQSPPIQEDWLTQSLRPFNSWNQATLTEPYLTRALDALPDIKLHRKIFFLGAWLSAFVDGQHSPEAQASVHAWLARKSIDPDLRLKVLEVSDALDRTVLIRRRFPE